MALVPVHVEQFQGLSLSQDPAEVGLNQAIDLLNVDFARQGRIRTRDGYVSLVAVSAVNNYAIAPHSTTHLVVESNSGSNRVLRAIDSAGAITASSAAAAGGRFSFASIGTTSATYTYGMSTDGGSGMVVRRWDGSAWSAPAGMPTQAGYLATQPGDNRLVHAAQSTSKVSFSDAGAPETFGANNYVYLSPGDGEKISGVAAWGGMLFVFKQTQFFVFYGNSTDSTGAPVFNYRAVKGIGIVGTNPKACVAGTNGLYFITSDGVYVTTGGAPTKISGQLDPLFGQGSLSSAWQGGLVTDMYLNFASLGWHADRLYCCVPALGGGLNTRMLVWDYPTVQWAFWDVIASGITSAPLGGLSSRLFITTGTELNVFGAYTTDNGTAITSRYRSGFSDLGGPGMEKTVRQTELVGQGTVSLGWSRDFGSITTTSTANVTLGTAPATARGLHRLSQNGELLGYQISSVSGGAWQVNRVTPMVRPFRQPGDKST